MRFSKEMKKDIMSKIPCDAEKCLKYIIARIEEESGKNGDFLSIQDFITRMFKANLDIHAFTVIAEYIPMKFPNGGDATMLRTVLAFMGYDPDYSDAPDIEIYPPEYWEDSEEMPFN